MENNKLPKQERLSGRNRIGKLFAEGSAGFVYPFRYIINLRTSEESLGGVSVLISVPKKNHKRAVKRNKVRRRTREAFRLGKRELTERTADNNKQVDLALIYVSKQIEEYKTIENAVGKILAEVAENI